MQNMFPPQAALNMDGAYDISNLALSQVKRAAELAMSHSKHNAEFAREQLSAISEVKDPAAVFQILQSQLEAAAKHAASAAAEAFELSQAFQSELSNLAETSFESKQAAVNTLIAETLKKAPQGSEAAVAAVQQAVEAGNKAVAEARKVAKQMAALGKQNMDNLKKQAPAAKKSARR